MKTPILKLAALFTAIFLINSLQAQDSLPKRIKEYGLGFANFNNFSMQYHWGSEIKFKALSLNCNFGGSFAKGNANSIQGNLANQSGYNSSSSNPISVNLYLFYSINHFKKLDKKFGLNYGYHVNMGYGFSQGQNSGTNNYNNISSTSTSKGTSESYRPGCGIMLGAYYQISEPFFLYLTLSPGIYYNYEHRYEQRKETVTQGGMDPQTLTTNIHNYNNYFGFGFSNSSAQIALVYRITYKAKL